MADLPGISIIIADPGDGEHIGACLSAVMKLDYPKDLIEVIAVVVNDGFSNGSAMLRRQFPSVRLIVNNRNKGFAVSGNEGAKAAAGEYVVFLSGDMKVKRGWLAALVETARSGGAQCVSSVIVSRDGSRLEFAGGGVSFYGMGYRFDYHASLKLEEEKLREDKQILFPCGGAMLVERRRFLEIGGFDESYCGCFEDVDFGWRLTLLGGKVMLSVASRANDMRRNTSEVFSDEHARVLYEKSSLSTIYKNYGDDLLQKAFWPAVLLESACVFDGSGIRREDLIRKTASGEAEGKPFGITASSAAQMCAMRDFIAQLESLTEKRAFIQSHRKVPDDEIIRLIPDPFICLGRERSGYDDLSYQLSRAFGVSEAFHRELRQKVLLVSSDKIGKKMAGPAIRYFEFAKALSRSCDVVLASFGPCDITPDQFRVFSYSFQEPESLIREAAQADIILIQGYVMESVPRFAAIAETKYLIVDLYDPFVIEDVEVFKDYEYARRRKDFEFASEAMVHQLKAGDFFLAANEKQKDYWFGMLSSLGRISPENYDISSSYRKLIDIVPFGISDEAPTHQRNVLKGVWPGIRKEDHVLIWGGGVWNWFDPLTLIRAIGEISKKREDVKLFFLGVKHPNPAIGEMKMLNEAVQLSKDLDLYDRFVFFNFDWVDYNDRQNYLLEADIGVSCHFDTIETRFSFRTRILDYLWAGLPIVATKGDFFADLVEREHLGLTVGFRDTAGLAAAIERLADDPVFAAACRVNIAHIAERYRWGVITKPVVDFCSRPLHSREVETAGSLMTEESVAAGSAGSAGSLGSTGSVLGRLQQIEERQHAIDRKLEKSLEAAGRVGEDVAEIKEWSYIMNGRFNKIKTYANPFHLLKRLLRRK